ncbi:hypothetical protein [Kribbella solani]|uniref:Uncharacterized protein n=1 Tax=Kribbella solani TaxID=236067 RepID=A0A841E4W4_9ACTN|nr:hypothetical protein [Kribbella solani]MBB5984025.1 hypothetical protein [Kribbella solani]
MFDTAGVGKAISDRYGTEGFEDNRPKPQRVMNESWPAPEVARALKDVEAWKQIDVEARVVLEQDGQQVMHGRAVRWTRLHVCVLLPDRRLLVPYVWLNPSDVRRTEQAPPAAPGS